MGKGVSVLLMIVVLLAASWLKAAVCPVPCSAAEKTFQISYGQEV